jgi:thiamine kinase-like enzyme
MTKHSASIQYKKDTITKRFKKKQDKDFIKFVKELSVYIAADKKKLDYIPQLVSFSYKNRSITTKKINGYDLGQIPEDDFEKREKFLPKIDKILKRLKKDLNLYHNDVLYRNFVYNPNSKKLYIIDFESVSISRTSFDKKDWIEYKLKEKNKKKHKNKKIKTKKK